MEFIWRNSRSSFIISNNLESIPITLAMNEKEARLAVFYCGPLFYSFNCTSIVTFIYTCEKYSKYTCIKYMRGLSVEKLG